MAKNSNAPDLDLNDEKTREFGDNTPFLPFGDGRYAVQLVGFVYHNGFKGRAYRAKVKILESDREDVRKGRTYVKQFKFVEDKIRMDIMKKDLRAFCAATQDADPGDAGFDGNGTMQLFLDLTKENEIEDADLRLEIVAHEKMAEEDDGSPKINRKTGKQQSYTNYFFNAVKTEAA